MIRELGHTKDGIEVKIGDVVWLASGGPPMTITSFPVNGGTECRWFGEGSSCEGTVLPSESLIGKNPGGDPVDPSL